MEGIESTNYELLSRIAQLEHERDALQKDIEQLCMQQAGPAYLVVATRMHFQRTTLLEQEIENLKKKLSACMRENVNLQEELSETYHVKAQLAELHSQEVSKNKDAEKQVKFFQNCMAAAFAERDQSLLEAEKAKESEEDMFIRMNDMQIRFEVLTKNFAEQKAQNDELQRELAKLRESMRLEKENQVVALRTSNLLLHDKLCESFRTEELLKKEVHILKKKNYHLEDAVHKGLKVLHQVHSEMRNEVVALLDEWRTVISSVVCSFQEIFQSNVHRQSSRPECDEPECKDVHITTCADVCNTPKEVISPSIMVCSKGSDDEHKALAQAMQEKVDALLLLSQQEELYLLQKNVQTALEKKCDDLQATLAQVTNEKVKALVELAQLRHEFQQLQETIRDGHRQGHAFDKEGKIRSMFRRSYLKQWIGLSDGQGNSTITNANNRDNRSSTTSSYSLNLATLKVENARLQESITSMEHITSCIHKLRLSLMKALEVEVSKMDSGLLENLDGIIFEANLIKTALGSSLPVSWSAEADNGSPNGPAADDLGGNDDVDCVSAAGFEMVELLLVAAQLKKASLVQKNLTGSLTI
ncbi:uncharacterized protein LOC116250224 isoform X2 [Nymphaea colorata]|uniref:uncharacterized protein LOC116250224 isoform X2 n=1 Tax=Nymphaea colorata TaxID=210225 RepID=UPI00129EB329|nr:uncharacterized protein LOC116250224 isoform X2 [Nymphaea colorata]